MTRAWFGRGAEDFIVAGPLVAGDTYRSPGQTVLTFWDAETGGTQYTDLLLNGDPVTSITVPASGITPAFQGPAGVVAMWAQAGNSTTRRMVDAGADIATQVAADREAVAADRAVVEGIGTTNDTLIAGRVADTTSATAGELAAAAGDNTHPLGAQLLDSIGDAVDPVAAALDELRFYRRPPENLQEQILTRHNTTLVRDFDTSSGITQDAGTVAYDTVLTYAGVRSIKLTTDTTTNVARARIDLGAATLDMSDAYFAIMGMIETGSPALSEIRFQLWGASFANLGFWSLTHGGPLLYSRDRWELVTVTNSNATVTSANVRYIDISITSATAGVAATARFNALRKVPNRAKGVVTFTLDGAYQEQYDAIYPLLEAKGYKANLMVNFAAGLATPGVGGYMPLWQAAELEAAGWDICTHSGVMMTGLTAQAAAEIAADRLDFFRTNGFNTKKGARFWANLTNAWDKNAADVLRQYFWFLRTGSAYSTATTAAGQPSLPVVNPSAVIDSASNLTYAQQSAKLQRAATHKQWCVLTWHQPDRPAELTYAEMVDMINLVETLGLEVMTFSEVLENVLNVGRTA